MLDEIARRLASAPAVAVPGSGFADILTLHDLLLAGALRQMAEDSSSSESTHLLAAWALADAVRRVPEIPAAQHQCPARRRDAAPGHPGAVYAYETTGMNKQFQVVAGVSTRPGQRNSLFFRYFLGWARGDTDGADSFPAIPTNIDAEYGRSSSDVRHRVMAGGNIQAPWGISIGPMLIMSTGRPYNITTGRDLNFDTVFSDRPSFGNAGQTGVIETEYGAFDTTGSGLIIPRNYGEGPAFASLSLRISKSIPFKKAQATTLAGGGPSGGGPMMGGGGGHGPGGDMGGMRGGGRGVPG